MLCTRPSVSSGFHCSRFKCVFIELILIVVNASRVPLGYSSFSRHSVFFLSFFFFNHRHFPINSIWTLLKIFHSIVSWSILIQLLGFNQLFHLIQLWGATGPSISDSASILFHFISSHPHYPINSTWTLLKIFHSILFHRIWCHFHSFHHLFDSV